MNINELRAEIRRRQRAANNKISRLKGLGLDLKSAGFDPRRPLERIDNYNSRQAQSYLAELNNFMRRENNYLAGARGAVIQGEQWRQYKELEKQYNQLGKRHEQKIGGLKIPTSNMTIKQREATLTPDNLRASGQASSRPYVQLNRRVQGIASGKGLNKLVKQLQKRLSPAFLNLELKRSRRELNDMLKTIGAGDLRKKARDLTDEQFDMLWNYTNFATLISGQYEIAVAKAVDSPRFVAETFEDQREDVLELLDWAASAKR